MQNKYTGDAGDFSKFLLIRSLKDRFKIGLNWCLVEDEGNNDGKHISYLSSMDGIYEDADKELITFLKSHISKRTERNIGLIENSDILGNTKFYSELIPCGTERFEWHQRSLKSLGDCEILFYDPDNGLEVKAAGILHEKSVKYLFYHEVKQTFDAGKSLVIYQHSNRLTDLESQARSRVVELKKLLGETVNIQVYSSSMGSSRFYICIENNLNFTQLIDERLKVDSKILNKFLMD